MVLRVKKYPFNHCNVFVRFLWVFAVEILAGLVYLQSLHPTLLSNALPTRHSHLSSTNLKQDESISLWDTSLMTFELTSCIFWAFWLASSSTEEMAFRLMKCKIPDNLDLADAIFFFLLRTGYATLPALDTGCAAFPALNTSYITFFPRLAPVTGLFPLLTQVARLFPRLGPGTRLFPALDAGCATFPALGTGYSTFPALASGCPTFPALDTSYITFFPRLAPVTRLFPRLGPVTRLFPPLPQVARLFPP